LAKFERYPGQFSHRGIPQSLSAHTNLGRAAKEEGRNSVNMPRKQKSNKSVVNTGSGKGQDKSSSKHQSNDEFPSHLLTSKNNQYHHCKTTNIEALVPNAVYIARNALSSRECQEWIKYAESSNNFDVGKQLYAQSILKLLICT